MIPPFLLFLCLKQSLDTNALWVFFFSFVVVCLCAWTCCLDNDKLEDWEDDSIIQRNDFGGRRIASDWTRYDI